MTGVALVLSSCGSSEAEQVRNSVIVAETPKFPPSFPLSFFLNHQIQSSALMTNAINESAAECMSEDGFKYAPPIVDLENSVDVYRRYGVTDVRTAQLNGYRISGPQATRDMTNYYREIGYPVDAQQLELYVATLEGNTTSQDFVTLNGTRTVDMFGGCLGKARMKVFGSNEKYLSFMRAQLFLEELSLQSFNALQNSPEFAQIISEWSQGMRTQGLNFENPDAAMSAMSFDDSTASPDEGEIATAVADAECKEETAFVSRSVKIETDWLLGSQFNRATELNDFEKLFTEIWPEFN